MATYTFCYFEQNFPFVYLASVGQNFLNAGTICIQDYVYLQADDKMVIDTVLEGDGLQVCGAGKPPRKSASDENVSYLYCAP